MKGIRFSNLPGLIRSGLNSCEGRADVVSCRFAVRTGTVHFNPIHDLSRFQWDDPASQLWPEAENPSANATIGLKFTCGGWSEADVSWRHHALELARQIRAEHPAMSKLNVVTEIASRWKRDLERCPGTGRLVRAIREWEEDGKLPLRSK